MLDVVDTCLRVMRRFLKRRCTVPSYTNSAFRIQRHQLNNTGRLNLIRHSNVDASLYTAGQLCRQHAKNKLNQRNVSDAA